jgi:hypothetical protein
VAFDSAGAAAMKDFIRPPELSQFMFDFMGWDRSLSDRAAAPTYPCLIDQRHEVAELYNMVNVPTAVWIDEQGRIVRPAEPAGTSDVFRFMDRETFTIPPDAARQGKRTKSVYVEALCDWIEKGEKSRHALAPQEVRRRMHGMSRDEAEAAATFRLGVWLTEQGHGDEGQKLFEQAVHLRPENWSFRRQKIVLSDPALTGQFAATPEYWEAVMALGDDGHYYPPIEMEGMPAPYRRRQGA